MSKDNKFNPKESPKTLAYVIERDTFTRRCNMCNFPVLKSDLTDKHAYQCMACDVDLDSAETHEGKYHTTEEFEELCCNTRDLLLLDE
ncbi:MAG: hypothetical protein K2H01_11480 [Ruminococcus sp.]|nr:hypothetical protein [Ruminococcus sp.]